MIAESCIKSFNDHGKWTCQTAGRQAVCGPTYLKGPAGAMLVVVADALQLAAACKLPGDKLEAPPQTFTVEEHEELGHHSGEENTGGIRSEKKDRCPVLYVWISIF